MKRIHLLTYIATISAILTMGAVFHVEAGLAFAQTQQNLNATSVYDSGQMILGNQGLLLSPSFHKMLL